ncbi:hypothetical protein Landi51_11631 [Colletotrichum acutatum]
MAILNQATRYIYPYPPRGIWPLLPFTPHGPKVTSPPIPSSGSARLHGPFHPQVNTGGNHGTSYNGHRRCLAEQCVIDSRLLKGPSGIRLRCIQYAEENEPSKNPNRPAQTLQVPGAGVSRSMELGIA